MTYASAYIYEGEFKNGKPCGTEKYTHPNGDCNNCKWVDGRFVIISQKIACPSGVYDGELSDVKFYGTGVITLANGDVYEGIFSVVETSDKVFEITIKSKDGSVFIYS